MAVDATCQHCGDTFEARRAGAKWCSDRCRKAAGRTATPTSEDEAPAAPLTDHGLVASVRRELEAAGRTDTFAGQLALQLAVKLASPDETGISSLSKELRTVMAAALDGVTPPPDEDASRVEPEDEVEKARRKREEARQAAGLA